MYEPLRGYDSVEGTNPRTGSGHPCHRVLSNGIPTLFSTLSCLQLKEKENSNFSSVGERLTHCHLFRKSDSESKDYTLYCYWWGPDGWNVRRHSKESMCYVHFHKALDSLFTKGVQHTSLRTSSTTLDPVFLLALRPESSLVDLHLGILRTLGLLPTSQTTVPRNKEKRVCPRHMCYMSLMQFSYRVLRPLFILRISSAPTG